MCDQRSDYKLAMVVDILCCMVKVITTACLLDHIALYLVCTQVAYLHYFFIPSACITVIELAQHAWLHLEIYVQCMGWAWQLTYIVFLYTGLWV